MAEFPVRPFTACDESETRAFQIGNQLTNLAGHDTRLTNIQGVSATFCSAT